MTCIFAFYFELLVYGLMSLPSDRFLTCLDFLPEVRNTPPAYPQARLREADDNLVIFVKFHERRGRGRRMT